MSQENQHNTQNHSAELLELKKLSDDPSESLNVPLPLARLLESVQTNHKLRGQMSLKQLENLDSDLQIEKKRLEIQRIKLKTLSTSAQTGIISLALLLVFGSSAFLVAQFFYSLWRGN